MNLFARHRRLLCNLLCLWLSVLGCQSSIATTTVSGPSQCSQTVYLTFDTGSQSQVQTISDILRKHHVKATFFLANEKTTRGDYSLDSSWSTYWQALHADGHAFGSHTFDHVFLQDSRAAPSDFFKIKPQFGANAGKVDLWTATQLCAEVSRVNERFKALTGHSLDPIWRAPGGRVSHSTLAAAQACGYQHVGWQSAGVGAGFSGDELPSQTYSNASLLKKSLNGLKNGDVFMAHLGIWSRKDAWAPAVLEPLIVGLKAKGTCFATMPQHPQYGNGKAIQTPVKF